MRIGDRFDKLVVVERLGTDGRKRKVLVRCDCGADKVVSECDLRAGTAKSCGCLRQARMRELNRSHGESRSPLHKTWTVMWERTRTRLLGQHYARPILPVAPEWRQYEVFRDYVLEHLGERPKGYSLDRIDNDRGYEPGNIRWASPRGQARNRSTNHVIEIDGVSRCIAEWAEHAGIHPMVIHARRRRGWSDRDAVLRPLGAPETITVDGESLPVAEWAKRLRMAAAVIYHRLDRGWSERDAVLTPPDRSNQERVLTIDGVSRGIVAWAKQSGVGVGAIRVRLRRGWSPRAAVFKPIK